MRSAVLTEGEKTSKSKPCRNCAFSSEEHFAKVSACIVLVATLLDLLLFQCSNANLPQSSDSFAEQIIVKNPFCEYFPALANAESLISNIPGLRNLSKFERLVIAFQAEQIVIDAFDV